jgi:hypothetical protein
MLLRALAITLVAILVLPGFALTREDRVVPGPLVTALAAWVSEATGLPMPATMPQVRFAAPRDMPGLMGAVDPASDGIVGSEIVAFYNSSVRAIYLPTSWTGSTPADLSILVHELVHHAQTSAGSRHACPAEREREAYDAQSRWLALFGTDLTREFGMDRMFLLVATTCGMP